MNKKFSTLMAASLLLAGSLWSGDASAATVKVTSLDELKLITNWSQISSQGESGTGVWTLLEELPTSVLKSLTITQANDEDKSIDKVVFAMSSPQTLTAYNVAKGGGNGVANLANYLRIEHPVTLVADASNKKITGMGLEVVEDGVTIDGLTLEVKSCNNQPTATKSAIVLNSNVKEATITNNTITDATEQAGLMSYGIVVKGDDTKKLKIEGNTLTITAVANHTDAPGYQTWVPSALSFTGLDGNDDSAAKIAAKNEFTDCVMDYADSRVTSGGKSYYYDAQVTMGTDEESFAQAVAELASKYKNGYTNNLTVNGADVKAVVAAITKAGDTGVSTVQFPDDFAFAVGGVNLVVGDASLDNENDEVSIDLDNLTAIKWTAAKLNAMLGNGFKLNLVANDHAITKGNIFDDALLSMDGDKLLVDGKYLTVDGTWKIDGKPYDKLATTDKEADAVKVEVYGIPSSEVVLYIKIGNQYLSTVATKDGDAIDEQYLTIVSSLDDANLSYAFTSDTRVNVYDKKNNPFQDRYVTMTFVSNDKNLKAKNGKVLGLSNNSGRTADLVEAARYLQAKPEGQWVVSLPDATVETQFTFTNRETEGAKFSVLYMNVIDADKNMYAVTYNGGSTFSNGVRDTFIINAVDPKLTAADFYVNYKETEIKDTQYKLAVASTEETDFYVTENHAGKHLLGLTKIKEDGENWKVVATGDTAIIINKSFEYNKKKKGFVEVADTMFIPTYAFQNAGNREFLTYHYMDGTLSLDEDAMICDKNVKDLKTAEDKNIENYAFVLKKKADGLFNIIAIEERTFDKDDKVVYYGLNLDKKLFGATTTKSGQVQVEESWEQINSNDLFKIVNLDAPEYHKVANGFGEVVSIFRADNESQVLYEKADKNAVVAGKVQSFLNIDNVNQFDKINPAMFVDTAYINRGTKENPNTCWQYLLAVNADVHDPDTCTVPGHPRTDRMVTGRYLINLMDTANVYGATHLHENPYINEGEAGEKLAKLAFVEGIHINDTLYVIRNNGDSVKLELDTPDFNVAKFAFRYVNPADESDKTFKIQTQIKNYKEGDLEADDEVSNEGYLKWINGTVVVVPTYERGDVFGINEDETQTPTANDEVEVSGISVVATNGAVIVKGAQGKTVVIANVLGQTIANTVLSSDKAEIAAPAGVVVVAVEGEAAVKAIVK